MVGLIQSSVSEEEEKKEVDLTSKPLLKGTETPKQRISPLLSTLSSGSVLLKDTIFNHTVHTLLLHDNISMEEAMNLIETSLQSESTSLTETDRVSIEVQLRHLCSMKDSKLSLTPSVILSLSAASWIWNDDEKEQIMQRIVSAKGKRSKVSDGGDKRTAKTVETDESKPKRAKKARSKRNGGSPPLKQLTLTIPNHTLHYDGYLLSPDLQNYINTNLGLFVDYKKRVENEDME